jgi:hypothetical protein
MCADARYPNINLTRSFVKDVFLSKLFGAYLHQAKPTECNAPGYASQAGEQAFQGPDGLGRERE